LIDFFKKSVTWAFGIVTGVFTFAPESFFEKQKWITQDILQHCKWLSGLDTNDINITISRVLCFLLIFVVTFGSSKMEMISFDIISIFYLYLQGLEPEKGARQS